MFSSALQYEAWFRLLKKVEYLEGGDSSGEGQTGAMSSLCSWNQRGDHFTAEKGPQGRILISQSYRRSIKPMNVKKNRIFG